MSASETESEKANVESPSQRATKRKAQVEEIEVDLTAPEPPSKKARRALKKGKPLPAKRGSDDENDEEEGAEGDTKKGKKEKVRSEHGVWIGNLPFYLTAQDLRKWLVDNAGGVIVEGSITRIKLPTSKDPSRDKKEKPTNKGFAYVDFIDLSTKVAAIALSENDLGGRKLLIKDSKSFEGRPAKEDKKKEGEESGEQGKSSLSKTEQRQENNASRKVFVGNLSFKTTQEDLERNFEKCGEIEWAKLATFEDSGKCKGFGWVKFKEPEAAAWAVKGFVKVKEAIETEEDFRDDSGDDDDGGDDKDDEQKDNKGNKDKSKQQQKQVKTRKWWVNRLFGRELKLELAEDDQSRYKKRFKKDAKRTSTADAKNSAADGEEPERKKKEEGHEADDKKRRRPEPAAMKTSTQDINVARLTGAVVAHTGTKVTFD